MPNGGRRTESGRMVVREGEVAWRGQRIGSGTIEGREKGDIAGGGVV